MVASASRSPTSGEMTIATTVLVTPPHTMAPLPAAARPAPTIPPTSACELLDGSPAHQVMASQAMAPNRAANRTLPLIASSETMPVPIVWATCRPNTRKAMKLKKAAHNTATLGDRTLVDTTVAIELAASCNPFMTSNNSANAMRKTTKPKPRCAASMIVVFPVDRLRAQI